MRYLRRHYRFFKWMPRKKHLKGSWLHRLLGERLFHTDLWVPRAHSAAAGLALGTFIGFTPTMGVQVLLAGIAAYLLRVNVPLALLGAFFTNPLTAPVIYAFEYKLGLWLVGLPARQELEGYSALLQNFARHAKPLWAGALVLGGAAAVVAYSIVLALWHLFGKVKRSPADSARKERNAE